MLADNWHIFLALTICSFIVALFVWSGFIYLTMISGVLLVMAIVQELWLILTGERKGYSPLDND